MQTSTAEALHILPGMLEDDIRQERELARLSGRTFSKRRNEAARDLGYGLRPTADAIPIWLRTLPDPHHIELLMAWVMRQTADIRDRVMRYLDNPSDKALTEIVVIIGGEIRSREVAKGTLTDLILRTLPANKGRLYELARAEHQARRPEAAVRQTLRNLIRQGRIQLKGEVYEATTL